MLTRNDTAKLYALALARNEAELQAQLQRLSDADLEVFIDNTNVRLKGVEAGRGHVRVLQSVPGRRNRKSRNLDAADLRLAHGLAVAEADRRFNA